MNKPCRYRTSVLKLGPQDPQHLVNGLLFKFSTVQQHILAHFQHILGGVAAHFLQFVKNPFVNLVLELAQLNILFILIL